MVRVDGQVMTDTRYREYLKEQAVKPSLIKRVAHSINRYFFGRPEVSLHDSFFFYGIMVIVAFMSVCLTIYGLMGG